MHLPQVNCTQPGTQAGKVHSGQHPPGGQAGQCTMMRVAQASGEHGTRCALQNYQMYDDDSDQEECCDPLWSESWLDLLPSSRPSQSSVEGSVCMSVVEPRRQPTQSRSQSASLLGDPETADLPALSARVTSTEAGLNERLEPQALQAPKQLGYDNVKVLCWGESPCLEREWEKPCESLPLQKIRVSLASTHEGVGDSSQLRVEGTRDIVGESSEVGPGKDKKSCEPLQTGREERNGCVRDREAGVVALSLSSSASDSGTQAQGASPCSTVGAMPQVSSTVLDAMPQVSSVTLGAMPQVSGATLGAMPQVSSAALPGIRCYIRCNAPGVRRSIKCKAAGTKC